MLYRPDLPFPAANTNNPEPVDPARLPTDVCTVLYSVHPIRKSLRSPLAPKPVDLAWLPPPPCNTYGASPLPRPVHLNHSLSPAAVRSVKRTSSTSLLEDWIMPNQLGHEAVDPTGTPHTHTHKQTSAQKSSQYTIHSSPTAGNHSPRSCQRRDKGDI